MTASITSGVYTAVFYVAMFWISGLTGLTRCVPPFLQMLADAVAILYVGSYMSLKFFDFISKPAAAATAEKPMSVEEGWRMPLVAGCFLVGLFVLFKYIGKQYVNLVLVGYFSLLGLYSVKFWIDSLLEKVKILDPLRKMDVAKIEVYRWCPGTLELSVYDLAGYAISAAIVVAYIYFRDWATNNVIGAAFCLYGLENLYIGRFTTAFLMLGLFFFYDIYFVFGTTVMVTVAMGIDGPIKLAFPRVLDPRSSILGLGDILVPGLLLSLCLRFDLALYVKRMMNNTKASLKSVFPKSPAAFPKPYFVICFIGYVIGLVLTIAVGVIFNAAQPALLYLVPLTVIPVAFTALVKGDIKEMIAYDEEDESKHLKELLNKKD